MTKPTVHQTTTDFYNRLPAFYRDTDQDQPNADGSLESYYPLLRYLSGAGELFGEVRDLITRFDYANNGTTSDLVDPVTANDDYIPWLAMLAGVQNAELGGDFESATWADIISAVDPSPGGDDSGTADWDELYAIDADAPSSIYWQELQDLNIASRSSFLSSRAQISRRLTYGHDEGTTLSIQRTVQSVLKGNKDCVVGTRDEIIAEADTYFTDQNKSTGNEVDATHPANTASDPWQIFVGVSAGESPGSFATIIDDVVAAVKPAGTIITLVFK